MKRLLVIRLSALGDAAILAPVLKAFALANTDVHFIVAAPPLLQPLFDGMPNVEFLGVKKRQKPHDIYLQLKSANADAVADMHCVNRISHALLLLRLDALLHMQPLPVRHIHKGRLSRWMMLHHWRTRRRSQWQRYADVFRRLGLKEPDTIDNQNTIQHTHRQPDTIGIAPFAQHKGKIWPFENTSRLALMLASQGHHVSLFGSKEEAPQLEALAAQHANIDSLAGKLPFNEELEIIRNLTLMVTMDSANMHFASAVGTPVVSIWGATHPHFGFYGFGQHPSDALCANLPCQPCSSYGRQPCRYGDYHCLQAISPEQALQAVARVIQRQNNEYKKDTAHGE